MQLPPRQNQNVQTKKPTFSYLNPQQLGNSIQKSQSRGNLREQPGLSPSVNQSRSLSQSRASSVSKVNNSEDIIKKSLIDSSLMKDSNATIQGNTLNEPSPLDRRPHSRVRKSIFDTKNLHESYVAESPKEQKQMDSPDLKTNYNRVPPEGLRPSQHQNDKFKQSQFTAATQNELESNKNSRMLDLSQMQEVKLEKQSSQQARKIWFDVADAIWKEPKERIQYMEKQQEQPLKQTDFLNLLGSLVCAPKPTQEKKQGKLVEDPHVEKALADSLATYFKKSNVSKTEPFYENETKIRAQDQVFIFRLSFRYDENDQVVFDWNCDKNYPSEDITARKYECVNYFIIDVFPDHIRVFNDFTVLPFCLNKNQQKYEVRTQLRSFIPLDDPTKATTEKIEPTPSETEASRVKQEPSFKKEEPMREYVPIEE